MANRMDRVGVRRAEGAPGRHRAEGAPGKHRAEGAPGKHRAEGAPGRHRAEGAPGRHRKNGAAKHGGGGALQGYDDSGAPIWCCADTWAACGVPAYQGRNNHFRRVFVTRLLVA
jgi:hypothetical protein